MYIIRNDEIQHGNLNPQSHVLYKFIEEHWYKPSMTQQQKWINWYERCTVSTGCYSRLGLPYKAEPVHS